MSTSVDSPPTSRAGVEGPPAPRSGFRWRSLVWPLAVLVVTAVAVPAMNDAYYEGLAVSALILVTLATSWNITGGFGGQLSFGHAAFYGVGAYTAGDVVTHLQSRGMAGVVIALLAAVLAGAVSSVLVLPGFRSQGPYFAILTLAVAESFQLLGQYFLPGKANGLLVRTPFGPDDHRPFYLALGVAAVAVAVAVVVRRTRLGIGLFAIRDDLEAAASVGVPTVRVRAAAFAVSAGVAGAAGGVYALTQIFVDPPTVFDASLSVLPVLIVTLGGTGTIAGPVLGALLWAGLNDEMSQHTANSGYTTLVYGVLLVALAILLPSGLMGLRRYLPLGRLEAVRTRLRWRRS
ncbi:MAG: branched-chain amino acid ABC transporter permease [Nocardioides sp.]